MPTKPSALLVFTFGTDANFTSGPANGHPVKVAPVGAAQGFVPGDGIESQSVNYMLNICGQWITDWVSVGTNTAAENAHIIETDSNGQANIARLSLPGHSVAGPTLSVSPSTSGASLIVTGGGTNFGATFSNGGSLAALRATATGTNYAIEGLALGTDNSGVRGAGTGAGHGVVGEGGGTGDGLRGTSGVTSGAGVRGIAGGSGLTGVLGIGHASAASYAIDGQSGHADARGVRGISHAAGSTTGAGVLGQGQANAVGVRAVAADGYALLVVGDTSSPVSAAVRLAPQDTQPSGAHAEGDLYPNGTNNLLWYRDNGGFKALHHSLYGYATGFDSDTGGAVNSSTEQAAAIATVTNKVTADLLVHGEVMLGGTAGEEIEVRLRSGAGTGGTQRAIVTIKLATTTAAAESHSVAVSEKVTGVAAGSNDFTLTVKRKTGANTIYWGHNTLKVCTIGG